MNARILTRAVFADLGNRPDESLDLTLAAILIAQEEYPLLRPSDIFLQLADLAARSPKTEAQPPRDRMRALADFLFNAEHFRPNETTYYDPRNSYINEVLERRTGIPITLSLILMEVARRIHLPTTGIPFPGRFLVGLPDDGDFYVDPFGKGRILNREECRDLFRRQTAGQAPWDESFLVPAKRKAILQRMLRNLKEIFLRTEDVPRCLAVAERLSALAPDDLEEVRDRGVLTLHAGGFVRALADLERYVSGKPEADDAELIRSHVKILRQQIGAV